MAERKTNSQLLDEALAQQAAGTYEDPLISAKRTLASISGPTEANLLQRRYEDAVAHEAEVAARPKDTTTQKIRSTLGLAAIPASFMGGPLGLGANALLAGEGVATAMQPGSSTLDKVLGYGGAALPAIHGLKALLKGGRGAVEAAEAVAPIARNVKTGTGNKFPYRDLYGSEKPYKGAESFSTAASPKPAAKPRMVKTGSFGGELDNYQVKGGEFDGWDFTGPTGGPAPKIPTARPALDTFSASARKPVNDVMANQHGLDFMHGGHEANAPIYRRMAEAGTFGDVAKGEQLAARGGFNSQTPELITDALPPSAGGSLGPMPESIESLTRSVERGMAGAPQAAAAEVPESIAALENLLGPSETIAFRGARAGNPGNLVGNPDATSMELANELFQRHVPGGRITALNKNPMPSGNDPLSKALRQRGHIAKRPGKGK